MLTDLFSNIVSPFKVCITILEHYALANRLKNTNIHKILSFPQNKPLPYQKAKSPGMLSK